MIMLQKSAELTQRASSGSFQKSAELTQRASSGSFQKSAKIAILTLNESDFRYNLFNYFSKQYDACVENISYRVFNIDISSENIHELIRDLHDKFDKILITNGLEDIDNYDTYSFNYIPNKVCYLDSPLHGGFIINKILENITSSSIVEELITNPKCDAVDTQGFVIHNTVSDKQVTEAEFVNKDKGGVYFLTNKVSNIYITYNCLDKISLIFPHFNIIYNEPYYYKTAICLSGNISAWPFVKETFINNIYNWVNPDIFIHTYKEADKTEDQIKAHFTDFPVCDIQIEDYKTMCLKRNDLAKTLNNLTGFRIPMDDPITGDRSTKGFVHLSKMYSYSKCNDLRKKYEKINNTEYDLVLHCNLNVMYLNPLFLDHIQDNTIYTCYGILCNSLDYNFFMGEPYTIDLICDTFKTIDKFYNDNNDEQFDIVNCMTNVVKTNNISLGKKLINCCLQKDQNIIYKHANSWIYLAPENYNLLLTCSYNLGDIYKIQKFKDGLLKIA